MPKASPVDQAFNRYRVLSRLIELEQERARSNPQVQRYLDLGITEMGDTKRQAARKTVETLDGLAKLIEHVAILDMVSSFERLCRIRIGNTAGEIKSLIKNDANYGRHKQFAAGLVRSADDFNGLREILHLFEGTLSEEVVDTASLVRASRNRFVHGTDLRVPPAVEPVQARDKLNEIASRL